MFSTPFFRNYAEKVKSLRREFLFKFAIHDLYMEKKANRGPGFQSFCLEFATHV